MILQSINVFSLMIRKQAIVYWDRIDNDSYIKRIEDFKGIKKLDFNKPITFLVEENGSEECNDL